MVECEDGYNMSEDSSQYSCGLNGTGVTWMLTGSGVICSPGNNKWHSVGGRGSFDVYIDG